MADLLQIVPTRSRPDNIRRVFEAWDVTGAWADADLLVAFDADDPQRDGYAEVTAEAVAGGLPVTAVELPTWLPMVHKLDEMARANADRYYALGFSGDDHLPRTEGWVKTYLQQLRELGVGIVYGDDGYQHENCPTQWAMTSDIVRALGRMVPAPVEHMYSDVSIVDLGRAAGCIRYLPEVMIEHMNPFAGNTEWDEQYRRVNSREQYRSDFKIYAPWKRRQLPGQATAVKGLRP